MGAAGGSVGQAPLPSGGADHCVCYGQPEPGTFCAFTPPAEPVEQERPVLNRDPRPAVLESEATRWPFTLTSTRTHPPAPA